MPSAFNKDTGELLVVDQTGKWAKPVMAKNPQTGEHIYLDGNEWKPVPLTGDEEGAGLAASALQGPTMGAGDELVAALENPSYAVRKLNPTAIGQSFGNYIMGREEPVDPGQKGYDESLQKFRDIESRYRAANPGKAFVATAGAGLLGGGYQLGREAFRSAAAFLPNAGRVGQAAATGAAFGGTAGFASGEGGLPQRLESAGGGAATGAVLGATLEAAIPALGGLIQRVRGNPRLYDPRVNRLTPEGEQAARQAGLDPAQASQALQQEFAREAQGALRPADAAATAQARTLPVPVNLRRGQATLDPDQQMFESQAGKGVYGQLAGDTIRASEAEQQAALRGNVREIGNRIGGGQVQELGQGATRAQTVLADAEQASREGYRNLYRDARNADGAATVAGPQVAQGTFNIAEGLAAEGFTRRSAPAVHEVLDEIQALATRSQQRPSTSIAEIWARRQELNALSRGVPSPQTAAAGNARRQLDRWLEDTIDNGLIDGDPAVVAMWRAADRARRTHAQQFEAGDFVSKLVARRPDGSNELALDPQSAVNLIFGRSETGFTSQNGMIRNLMRIRTQLGPNSQAWNGLREEAFLRMARAGEGASTPTGRDFSGANFAKAWENALAKSPGTMRLLFTEQERNLISQFANIARRTTTAVKGGANTSNTSAGAAQIVRRLFASAFMGPKMAAMLESTPIVSGLANIAQEMRASRAVLNRIQQGTRPQPTPRLNRAVEGGTGSTAGALVQGLNSDR